MPFVDMYIPSADRMLVMSVCACVDVSSYRREASVRCSFCFEGQCESLGLENEPIQTLTLFCIHLTLAVGSQPSIKFNMEKSKKEELQSRRQFFKKAAKTALPILGAIALANVPLIGKASTNAMGCSSDGCSASCRTSCQTECRGHCRYACNTTCSGSCSSRAGR